MIITPAKSLDLLASDLVRSPGLHASEIYGKLYKHLEPKRYGLPDAPQEPNDGLMALGSAWEDRLEKILRWNGVDCERPGEFVHTLPDGQTIAYSPDIMIYNGVTRCGEIKLTSMDVTDLIGLHGNGLPPKFDKYLTQMMLYIKWLGLQPPAGWLGILSIRQPHKPVFVSFDLEFSQRDLDDCERECLNFARHEGMI